VYTRPLVEGAQSRFELVTELARRDGLTVRQLIGRLGGGRGHRTFAGTPEQVADTIHVYDTHPDPAARRWSRSAGMASGST
jgi:alkanesulfonate monooxygenase SsuD/methylene tetrahydromethanopterin reductase-like flavin-dependent oxidoreductase (luciferase family)